MQTMRRRGPAAAVPAIAGWKASRHGNASDTPAACRNRRLEKLFMGSLFSLTTRLLSLEKWTLHDFMDERTQAVLFRPDPFDDRVHLGPVDDCRCRPGRVGQQ